MSSNELPEFNIEENTPHKGKSIYIKASAGTGKTHNIKKIVRKILERKLEEDPSLLEKENPLEKILIVTFTEKAAGELRDRIRNELFDYSDVDVDNAPIYTIHSFCQHSLEEFSFTAKKPISLELIDESEINDFIDKAIRDGLENNEEFRKDAIEIFKNLSSKNQFFENIKRDFKSAAGDFYPGLVDVDEIYFKYKTKSIQKDYSFEECDEILAQIDNENETIDSKNVFSGRETNTRPKKVEKYKTARFYKKFLKSICEAWQKEKSQNKKQTYNDMIQNVREAVCEKDSALKKALQKKYEVAIIDEFQDTNQLQWDIFREIFLNDEHSLIVVGDPKQSIYAFQGADINVYEKAISEIKNGFKLSHNFRSTDEMIKSCNDLFETNFFVNSKLDFFPSEPPKDMENRTLNAVFDNQPIEPFWICFSENAEKENQIAPEDFAKISVKQIVEFCSFSSEGKTRLQIYDKKNKRMRNVSFTDFAVLAKTSSEMEEIELAMKHAGIPFLRYKDKNLFSGLESSQWIALLNAIAAPDFMGRNRAILSEALFTDFFQIPLEQVKDEKYDSPANNFRKLIIEWKCLAENREWAKMLESIFEKTKIEENLSALENLQSLSKFRQIGEYIVEYLYKNDSSLDGAARHLSRLATSSEETDGEESLVARGTDYDCVQVMTIHASKGLEFPVVIAVAGFKGPRIKSSAVYYYHDGNKRKLCFGEHGKDKMKEEEEKEFQRLYYVAYTRASSLMILPYYENIKRGENTFHKTVMPSLSSFIKNTDTANYRKIIFSDKEKNAGDFYRKINKNVQLILQNQRKVESDSSNQTTQENEFEKLEKVSKRILKKNSYTSLSNHTKNSRFDYADQNGRNDKEENSPDENIGEEIELQENLKGYPRGNKIGSALHEIAEKIDFECAQRFQNFDEFSQESEIKSLIDGCFSDYGFEIDENDSKGWSRNTAFLIWNTLQAKIPETVGKKSSGSFFSLKEISMTNRASEAEFNFKKDCPGIIQNYFNGFIDLIFVRKVEGRDVYSVLDWKSDTLENYSDPKILRSHTDEHYAVQQVLYSYCLIKWLKTFSAYNAMEESEIFANHFGGIYYVYLRGTKENESSGICEVTWKDWDELNEKFDKICKEMEKENA